MLRCPSYLSIFIIVSQWQALLSDSRELIAAPHVERHHAEMLIPSTSSLCGKHPSQLRGNLTPRCM